MLLINNGRGRFEPMKFSPESYFSTGHWGRGLAVSDLDRDGDLDQFLAFQRTGGRRGERDRTGQRLAHRQADRHRVPIEIALGPASCCTPQRTITCDLCAAGEAILSQGEYAMYWGIPAGAAVRHATVYWPSGLMQQVDSINGPGSYSLFEPAMPVVTDAACRSRSRASNGREAPQGPRISEGSCPPLVLLTPRGQPCAKKQRRAAGQPAALVPSITFLAKAACRHARRSTRVGSPSPWPWP